MLELVTKKLVIKFDGDKHELLIPGIGIFDKFHRDLKKAKSEAEQFSLAAGVARKMGMKDKVLDWIDFDTLSEIIQEAQKQKKSSPKAG